MRKCAPLVTEVKVKIGVTVKNKSETKELTFRWIYMRQDDTLITRGEQGGQWYLIGNFRLKVSLMRLE